MRVGAWRLDGLEGRRPVAYGCEGSSVIRIGLEQAANSDRPAKPVSAMDGKMLLNSGVELTEDYVVRLLQHGVSEVCVCAPHVQVVAAEDAISDASRIEIMACAHACMVAARDGAAIREVL